VTAEIRRPRDEPELSAAIALRDEVFCGEQGVTAEADRDGLDPEALHLIAVDEAGEVVGTCRMLIEPGGTAKFGRLCVRASVRGTGVGGALLRVAEDEARAAGARRVGMHAQTGALALYRRAGFRAYGETFDEEGIEHVGMEKELG
jgi:predicted GNAT family N-acyltransferase